MPKPNNRKLLILDTEYTFYLKDKTVKTCDCTCETKECKKLTSCSIKQRKLLKKKQFRIWIKIKYINDLIIIFL